MVAALAPVAALDIVELTPAEDAADATLQAAIDVAVSALARQTVAHAERRRSPAPVA